MYSLEYSLSKRHIHHFSKWLIVLAVFALGVFSFFVSVQLYPQAFSVEARLEKHSNIGPKDPIVVSFSHPMFPASVKSHLAINHPTDVMLRWEDSNQKLTLTPKGEWKPEDLYHVKLQGGSSVLFTRVQQELAFTTVSYPKVQSFFPAPGATDVVLDIEDPVAIVFDKPINDFKLKFVVSPIVSLADEIDFEKNTVKLIPQGDLTKGQRYDIAVFVRHQDEGVDRYQKIYETYFETKKPLPPQQWEKDFGARLEQAKLLTDPKITEGKYIDINLKSQVMTLFENGKAVDAYIVSTGKRGMETPVGNFQIRNHALRVWSKKYGLFMPYWMAVAADGSFGIHELPEWPGGYKEGQNHLGIPVSHGCIRLGVGPAARVYAWAENGTPVVTHY